MTVFLNLLFLLAFFQPSHVLVLKNGKQLICTKYQKDGSLVTIHSKGKVYSVPDKLIDWEKSRQATVQWLQAQAEKRNRQQKKAESKRVFTPKKPAKAVVLTNAEIRKIAGPISGPVTVSYRKMGNNIIVQTSLNGRGPYDFVLDTGAAITLLSPASIQELGISPSGAPIQLSGVEGRSVSASQCILNEVSLGGARVHDLRAVIRSIPLLNRAKVIGLLGQDFLDHFVMNLNSGNQTLTLTPHGGGDLDRDLRNLDEKALENPEQLFLDFERQGQSLQQLFQGLLNNGAEKARVANSQRLKQVFEELPEIQLRMHRLRRAVENNQGLRRDETTRADVSKFLNCYPLLRQLMGEMQGFSRSLRKAYSHAGDEQKLAKNKKNLWDEWNALAAISEKLEACR